MDVVVRIVSVVVAPSFPTEIQFNVFPFFIIFFSVVLVLEEKKVQLPELCPSFAVARRVLVALGLEVYICVAASVY